MYIYIYIYTHVDGTEMRVWRNEQSDEGIYGPRRLRELQHVADARENNAERERGSEIGRSRRKNGTVSRVYGNCV